MATGAGGGGRSLNAQIVVTQKGAQQTAQQISKVGTAAQKAGDQTDFLKKILATLGGAAILQELARLSDSYTSIQNRIKVVTSSQAELGVVTDRLFEISNRTRTSFESTAEIYSRLAFAAQGLGFSQEETLKVTNSLNEAILVSGARAKEGTNALIQLSQAISSGRLAGDEFRAVTEQLPIVARAIETHLGITRGELRKLSKEQKITSQIIFDSILAFSGVLEEKVAKTKITIEQSFLIFENQLTRFIGKFNEATGAAEKFAKTIRFVADHLEDLVKAATALAVVTAVTFTPKLIEGFAVIVFKLATAFGTATFGAATLQVAITRLIASSKILITTLAANPLTWIGLATVGVVAFKDKINVLRADVGELSKTDLNSISAKLGIAENSVKKLGSEFGNSNLKKAANTLGITEDAVAKLAKTTDDFSDEGVKKLAANLGSLSGEKLASTAKVLGTTEESVKHLSGALQKLSGKELESLLSTLKANEGTVRNFAEGLGKLSGKELTDMATRLGLTEGEVKKLSITLAHLSESDTTELSNALNNLSGVSLQETAKSLGTTEEKVKNLKVTLGDFAKVIQDTISRIGKKEIAKGFIGPLDAADQQAKGLLASFTAIIPGFDAFIDEFKRRIKAIEDALNVDLHIDFSSVFEGFNLTNIFENQVDFINDLVNLWTAFFAVVAKGFELLPVLFEKVAGEIKTIASQLTEDLINKSPLGDILHIKFTLPDKVTDDVKISFADMTIAMVDAFGNAIASNNFKKLIDGLTKAANLTAQLRLKTETVDLNTKGTSPPTPDAEPKRDRFAEEIAKLKEEQRLLTFDTREREIQREITQAILAAETRIHGVKQSLVSDQEKELSALVRQTFELKKQDEARQFVRRTLDELKEQSDILEFQGRELRVQLELQKKILDSNVELDPFQVTRLANAIREAEVMKDAKDIVNEIKTQTVDLTDAQEANLAALELAPELYRQIHRNLQEITAQLLLINNPDNSLAGVRAGFIEWKLDVENLAATFDDFTQNQLNGLADAFVEFSGGNKVAFRDFAQSLIADLQRIIFKILELKLILAAGGLFGGGKSPLSTDQLGAIGRATIGFASGGQFNVGGTGGVDSQLVQFRATPGERVTVETPGQQRQASASPAKVNVINVMDPNDIPVGIESENGTRSVLNVISRNRSKFRQALGV